MRTTGRALDLSRSTVLRHRQAAAFPSVAKTRGGYETQNALSAAEFAAVLELLNSDRFADLAPAQVFAQLIDEGCYLCSVSTMYRLLRANAQVRERRHLARHPGYRKPELLTTAPRQVFTWDITNVRGPQKGVWFSLLVMIDIFSRYVVGWMLVNRANASIAKHFIAEVLEHEAIVPGQADVHADRGTEVTAQPVCALLDELPSA